MVRIAPRSSGSLGVAFADDLSPIVKFASYFSAECENVTSVSGALALTATRDSVSSTLAVLILGMFSPHFIKSEKSDSHGESDPFVLSANELDHARTGGSPELPPLVVINYHEPVVSAFP
jgi:hypothetical protein